MLSAGQFRQQQMLPGMANVAQPSRRMRPGRPVYQPTLPGFPQSARVDQEQPAPHDSTLHGSTLPETQGGGQLGMFYTGPEIKQHWDPLSGDRETDWDTGEEESADQLWERKAAEAYDQGLSDDIAERGILNPVQVAFHQPGAGKPEVLGGHHRIAAAAEDMPSTLIPVMHYPDMWAARQDPHHPYEGADKSGKRFSQAYQGGWDSSS